MTKDADIRHDILKMAAECSTAIGWQDSLRNDIALDLLHEKFVRGGTTDGGYAYITGVTDKGRKELERNTVAGKAKHFSKRVVVFIWAIICAVFVYVMQLEIVRQRLSRLFENMTK